MAQPLTYMLTNSRALSSRIGAKTQKAPETYGEELNYLVSKKGVEWPLSLRALAETIVSLLRPSSSQQADMGGLRM